MKLLLFFTLLIISGCAELSAFKSGIATHGALIADETRVSAEWTLCKAITVGAWVRAYANDPEKAAAWRKLCTEGAKETP